MNSRDPWWPLVLDPRGNVIWPAPIYRRPFQQEVPSWIHYGDPDVDGTTRQLFDGALVGAAGAPMQSTPLAPLGGITFKKELDARQVLHVEICADGKCYRTAMDLAPAIAMVMAKLAQTHVDLHRAAGAPLPGDTAVVTAVDRAVNVAGDALIGVLVDQALVGNVLGSIWHGLGKAAGAVGGVAKKLKTPLSIAAGAAATAFGGPAAGALAAKFTGTLIDHAPGGHPAVQAAAAQALAAAQQAAQSDPTVQAALEAAQHVVSQTAAAMGHAPVVAHPPNSLGAAVQKFLPQVLSAATGKGGGGMSSDLQGALSAFGGLLGSGGAAVSGPIDVHPAVGAAIAAVRARAQDIARANPASVVGVIHTARGVWQSRGFRSADVADDWFGAAARDPSTFTYAAYFDKGDVLWPYPLNERIGAARVEHLPISGWC